MEEWIAVPILSAALAALGYVGKLIVDAWLQWRRTVHQRQASLVQLQSLLLASGRVFAHQADLRNRLHKEYVSNDPSLDGLPYDEVLARSFAEADAQQKHDHGLIRQYTISAMRPLNQSMLDWLANDTYYKIARKKEQSELALKLRTLEAHLILWNAKFDFWIPDHPERALVYTADELKHGVGFPSGLDQLVFALAGGTWRK